MNHSFSVDHSSPLRIFNSTRMGCLFIIFTSVISLMAAPTEKDTSLKNPEVVLRCNKSVYAKGTDIRVHFDRKTANKKDWIGIYHKGDFKPSKDQFLIRGYLPSLKSQKSGTIAFKNLNLPDGEYSISYFKNDSNEMISKPVHFTVKHVQKDKIAGVLFGLGGISVILTNG